MVLAKKERKKLSRKEVKKKKKGDKGLRISQSITTEGGKEKKQTLPRPRPVMLEGKGGGRGEKKEKSLAFVFLLGAMKRGKYEGIIYFGI